MKFRCLFRHDWEYYTEDREFMIEYNYAVLSKLVDQPHSKTITEHIECRVCNRCHKKMSKQKITKSSVWKETEPSVSDIRNTKLKDLGI